MSRKRKVCVSEKGLGGDLYWKEDPSAPSVSEIVEVLREAKETTIRALRDWGELDPECKSEVLRIDNLIYRLEQR